MMTMKKMMTVKMVVMNRNGDYFVCLSEAESELHTIVIVRRMTTSSQPETNTEANAIKTDG